MAVNPDQLKSCPNCGNTWIAGAEYCSRCGQDDKSYKKSFGHLMLEFLETWLHFDTKSFRTFMVMFLYPGQLTVDFLDGKRARYVPPFRLYIFLSVIYFFLLATVQTAGDSPGSIRVIYDVQDSISLDSNSRSTMSNQSLAIGNPAEISAIADTLGLSRSSSNVIERKSMQLVDKLGSATQEQVEYQLINTFSKALFLLMPIFALILKMLYVSRKRLYFDHLIFAIQIHSQAIFLLLLALLMSIALPKLNAASISMIIILFYGLFSMKRIYGQSWGKTAFKFVLLFFSYGIVMFIGFLVSLILGISTLH
jgi:hypothetical protein